MRVEAAKENYLSGCDYQRIVAVEQKNLMKIGGSYRKEMEEKKAN
jgi:hypothetical protein